MTDEELSFSNKVVTESFFNLEIPDKVWNSHRQALEQLTHDCFKIIGRHHDMISKLISSMGYPIKRAALN